MPPAWAIDPDPREKQISTQGLKLVLPAFWGVPKFRDIASNPCSTPCLMPCNTINPDINHRSNEQCHYAMPPARAIDPDPCEKHISTQGLKLVLPALWGVPKFRDIASNPCSTPCLMPCNTIHPNIIHRSDEECHSAMPPAWAIDPDPCEKQISTQGLKLV
jgi:hypothetical protein